MIRELKEEAGIIVKKDSLKFVHLAHRLTRETEGQERVDIFFECWDWDGEPRNTELNKCDELTWFSVDKLPSNTLLFVRSVVNDVISGTYFSEYTTEPF